MKLRHLIAAALVAVLAASPLAATSSTWSGWITDEDCGVKGANAEHKDCLEKCHAKGIPLAFYNDADKKVYKIDDQKLAEQHLGHPVRLTGTLDGDRIRVEKIEAEEASDD
jgi:hypothetical protein